MGKVIFVDFPREKRRRRFKRAYKKVINLWKFKKGIVTSVGGALIIAVLLIWGLAEVGMMSMEAQRQFNDNIAHGKY